MVAGVRHPWATGELMRGTRFCDEGGAFGELCSVARVLKRLMSSEQRDRETSGTVRTVEPGK